MCSKPYFETNYIMKLYNTDPTFHTSAKSMMTAVLAGCVILLGGCSGHSHDDHEGESHSDTEHSAGPVNDNHGHEHEEIILSSCQAKAAGVEIGEVQPGDLSSQADVSFRPQVLKAPPWPHRRA